MSTGGFFKMSREVFENPIWNDVPKFRIFFYIVGQAVFAEEGVNKAGIKIERGQYLRSYRNLRSDLEYVENRSIKKYSLSLIKKKIEQLVKEERLKIEDTELGTLFTVVNYASYQGFYDTKKNNENAERTEREQNENGERTEREQNENNNNNVNKANKENKAKKERYLDYVLLTDKEYNRLIDDYGKSVIDSKIEDLNNYIGSSGRKYKDHNLTLRKFLKSDGIQKIEKKTKQDVKDEIKGYIKEIDSALAMGDDYWSMQPDKHKELLEEREQLAKQL